MSRANFFRPWLAGLALLASGGAWAAIVEPITVLGDNFTSCSQLDGGWEGGSMSTGNTPGDGQTYDLGGGQSITFTYQGGTNLINFSATVPVDYVVVKGGNAYNIFHYVPPVNSDTGLYAPNNGSQGPAGVSHVVACFKKKPSGSKTAFANWTRYTDWSVDKSVTPTSITMFDGDSHDADYTVNVTPATRGTYKVWGEIIVRDPWLAKWSVESVSDAMTFTGNATAFTLSWDGPGGHADTMNCTPSTATAGNTAILSCSYSFELNSAQYPFLLNASGGHNTAHINTVRRRISEGGGSGSIAESYAFDTAADFSIGTPVASYGDTVNVDDNMVAGAPDKVFTRESPHLWNYTRTFSCDADEGSQVNTATATWNTENSTGSASDSATVTINCETVSLAKTANTSYSRDYSWRADKKIVVRAADVTSEDKATACALIGTGQPYAGNYLCDAITLVLDANGVYDTVYALQALRSVGSEYAFAVDGQITATWPTGMNPVFSGDPVDTLLPSNQVLTVGNCTRSDTQLVCDYQSPLADKTALTNQASLSRPHVCYSAGGQVRACAAPASSSYTATAPVSFGDPNLTRYACVRASDLFNDGFANTAGDILPGAGFAWDVEQQLCQSQSFYPTGNVVVGGNTVGNLAIHADWAPAGFQAAACTFNVPNLMTLAIEGDGNVEDLANINVNVPSACQSSCTYTQGYWKTHSKYGPAPYDDTWMKIGEDTMFFSAGQSWYKVFWTPPKGGNAYYILAHQYMAARLNLEAGASMPANVASALSQASAWFNGRSADAPKGAARTTAISLAGTLAAYNEGVTGPGHCSVSPAVSEE